MSETPLKQLTDSNSNNFYPVTSSSGVYRPDSSTVEAALAAIPTATSDLENDSNFISEGQANSITGSMIQDNTVTADNIDFTTLPQMLSSGFVSGTNGTRSYIKIGRLLIQYGTRRGGTFQEYQDCTFLVPFANDNYSLNITNQFNENGGSIWYAFVRNKTATGFQYSVGLDGGGYFGGNANNVANWIAIGNASN